MIPVLIATTPLEAQNNIDKYTASYGAGLLTLEEATDCIIRGNRQFNYSKRIAK